MSDEHASGTRSTIETADVDHVFVEFPDMNGLSRSVVIGASHFRSGLESGFSMNLAHVTQTPHSDAVEGSKYAEAIDYADGLLRPDLDTFRVVPWRENAARVICDLEYEGTPVSGAPRRVLKRVLSRLESHGLEATVGNELEFYLLDRTDDGYRPATSDKHENLTRATESVAPFYERVHDWAPGFDLDVTKTHHEFGAGQLEIVFEQGAPLAQADRTFRFKELVKRAADVDDREATFMAKPFSERAGSGYHLHVSLHRDGENVLDGTDGLSATGAHFVGGLLEHAPALTALGTPNLNGFKRHHPGTFAPATSSWGHGNRMTSFRVPEHGTTRVENRIPSADANPYLVIASTLAAGLHGVEEGIEPPAPSTGDPSETRSRLPRTPHHALDALESDDALATILGESVVSEYVLQKRQEIDAFYDLTTEWERQQYVEMF